MKAKRLTQLAAYIAQNGICSYEELSEHYGVSSSTIRRDIEQLLQSGVLQKSHGGVISTANVSVPGINTINQNSSKLLNSDVNKDAIAKEASQLIKDNEVVFLGSGSTVARMVPHLKDRRGITIVSNNLLVINEALQHSLNTMVIGGNLNKDTMSIVGLQSIKQLQALNINKAFIGCNGVTITGRITNTSEVEADIKREAMRGSNERYLLTDHQKFGKMALYTFAELREFSATITDILPSAEYMDTYEKIGQKLIIANF